MIPVTEDPAYPALKNHLIETTGLAFYASRDRELTELIRQRLSTLELRDCSSYAEFLKGNEAGQAEMDVVIAQLTIGETSFFRDPETTMKSVFAKLGEFGVPPEGAQQPKKNEEGSLVSALRLTVQRDFRSRIYAAVSCGTL